MENHKENKEQKKIVIAGCVIVRDEKILLLHRITTGWLELPGGKVEDRETNEEAAKRELNEELSCDVEIVRKLGVKDFDEGSGRNLEYHWFLATIPEGQTLTIGEPGKFDRFEWIPISELRNHTLSPNMKNLIEIL